jgi:hypothetical protein
MRDPTIRFALDAVALTKLQEVARQQNLSLSQLLKNLVYQAINEDRQKYLAARYPGREAECTPNEPPERNSNLFPQDR